MKILILSNKFPYPLKDGGAIAVFNLMKGLAKAGNKLVLLTFNTKKHFFNPENFPFDKIPGLEIHSVSADTTPKILPALNNLFFSHKPYIEERFYRKEFEQKLIFLLKKYRFDIVQVESLYLLQYIPVIKANSHAIISYRAHNAEHEIWQNLADNKKNPVLRFYLNILSKRIKQTERSIINKYNALIPISEKDYDFFKQNGNNKPYIVCPAGFDAVDFDQYNKSPDTQSLYFIGSLEWMPNREAVLWFTENCWDELKRQLPELKLFIAGRNAPDGFKQQISKKDIIFSGEVKDARSFIEDKSIMIVPLLSGSGMRVKIIEAFFMNKAVVSTKLGAEGTKSTHKKNILIAENKEEFIQSIKRLIMDKKFYRNIVENAGLLANKYFDNQIIANNLSNFYRKIS